MGEDAGSLPLRPPHRLGHGLRDHDRKVILIITPVVGLHGKKQRAGERKTRTGH